MKPLRGLSTRNPLTWPQGIFKLSVVRKVVVAISRNEKSVSYLGLNILWR